MARPTKEIVESLYMLVGATDSTVAESLGLSRRYVTKLRHKYGIVRTFAAEKHGLTKERLTQLEADGLMDIEIAELLGVDKDSIYYYRKTLDSPHRITLQRSQKPKAIQLYLEGKVAAEIAEALGVPNGTVYTWLKSEGIGISTRRRRTTCNANSLAAFELRQKGHHYSEIAELLNLKSSGAAKALVIQHQRGSIKREVDLPSADKMLEVYTRTDSAQSAALELGMTATTLLKYLRKAGIPIEKKALASERATKRERKRKRQELERSALGSHTPAEWREVKRKFDQKCAYCNRQVKLSKDHVIALSKGGSNFIENIVPACIQCNSAKATKDCFVAPIYAVAA